MGFSYKKMENLLLEIGDCDNIARPEYWPGYKCFYIILSRKKPDIFEATKAFPDVKRRKSAEETEMKNTKAQRKRI